MTEYTTFTINIAFPNSVIERLQKVAKRNLGREATQAELQEFIERDCNSLYLDNLDDGFITIEDSFELYLPEKS